ncbi:uncharacterized protein L969DRAFT_96793 [Mixia osmundae IAM 14324]|uniref:Citrate transporter-like domain-containing protein n=1 Tax=Mixia osmundae (strain CBS 9802 / IAM 14324 / JCM 22182 / KY 12970) TaxID=764103 RepID=G7E241_MIXOS|nr:uncharacterized protein L969DRAFT_96793 [Mixia osmundae IAM 14324]KEI36771.1 hypothetical protein L969DRAFT_96793 [Mixia osmundae IAM 14324]GAA96901.1 hypothetical protein E5Q_03574 [Mixia osmundae IAM 14324]
MTVPGQHDINGHSIWGLIVVAAVLTCVLRPLKITLPGFCSRWIRQSLVSLRLQDPHEPAIESSAGCEHVQDDGQQASARSASFRKARMRLVLSLETAPVVGVLLLLATVTIPGSVLRLGIVGDEGVRPYDVLVLFISLAYISTALDATGALRSLAFWVSQKGGGSGARLYLYLYLLFFAAGAIFGNDPVILSGTAFLAYFTRVNGITPPTAWTFAQFMACNIASAVLVSSNPTNVLLAGAFNLNFLTGFTAYTALPSVVCAIVGYLIMFATFRSFTPREQDEIVRNDSNSSKDHPHNPPRKSVLQTSGHEYIPKRILPPDVSPRDALLDPRGAAFYTILMLVTLATLVGTSFVSDGKVQVWMVTAPAGLLALAHDIVVDWRRWPQARVPARASETVSAQADATAAVRIPEHEFPPSRVNQKPSVRMSLPQLLRYASRRFPVTSTTVSRLPLPLLPFAFSWFILVRGLGYLGWISTFARWAATMCVNSALTAFVAGYFGVILCIGGTNIAATIILVEIFSDPAFARAPHIAANPEILTVAIFSSALAVNLGAFGFVPSASLAGLLWRSILAQKGIHVSTWSFCKWNLAPVLILSTVASAIVLAEVKGFGLQLI